MPSQTRSTNWQEIENIEDLEKFLTEETALIDLGLAAIAAKNAALSTEKSRLESELNIEIANLENAKKEKILLESGLNTEKGLGETNE